MTKPFLKLTELTKAIWRSRGSPCASLDVGEGEIVALLGTRGRAKTTLLRLIAKLGTPERGDIWIVGEQSEQQRGALAQALVGHPRLRLLDEGLSS